MIHIWNWVHANMLVCKIIFQKFSFTISHFGPMCASWNWIVQILLTVIIISHFCYLIGNAPLKTFNLSCHHHVVCPPAHLIRLMISIWYAREVVVRMNDCLSHTSQEPGMLMMLIKLCIVMTYLFCHLSTLLVDLCMSRLTPLLTQTSKVFKEHVVPGQRNDRIHLVIWKNVSGSLMRHKPVVIPE